MLSRQYPEIIPQIYPMPEYLATGQRLTWYEEMKEVLQVPWMGVVTMAYSHYPVFFAELWRGLKPLSRSRQFVDACKELRQLVESETRALDPTPLVDELRSMRYAEREIDHIRQINSVFSHGNQAYVIIATITRHLLEIGDMKGKFSAEPYDGYHGPDATTPFLLMEPHHVDRPTHDIFEDIKQRLRLPFVNTDYRAFARWPSYFSLAWSDLREKVITAQHEAVCQACHHFVAELAADVLPNPGRLRADSLRRAAGGDAGLEEITHMCRLFQWLLPGLITNVAYLRHQLLPEAQSTR